eukprot:7249220-Alexandrium_andersonii.AAC.1
MPPPVVPAPRSRPAAPRVPAGAVLSEAEREEVVNRAREAMAYAAKAELTPMVHFDHAASFLGVRSELSMPEPLPGQDVEDSDASSQ